ITLVSESSSRPLASCTCSLPASPAAVRSDSRCITAMFCTPYWRASFQLSRSQRAIARCRSTTHASSSTTMRLTPSSRAQAPCNHAAVQAIRIGRAASLTWRRLNTTSRPDRSSPGGVGPLAVAPLQARVLVGTQAAAKHDLADRPQQRQLRILVDHRVQRVQAQRPASHEADRFHADRVAQPLVLPFGVDHPGGPAEHQLPKDVALGQRRLRVADLPDDQHVRPGDLPAVQLPRAVAHVGAVDVGTDVWPPRAEATVGQQRVDRLEVRGRGPVCRPLGQHRAHVRAPARFRPRASGSAPKVNARACSQVATCNSRRHWLASSSTSSRRTSSSSGSRAVTVTQAVYRTSTWPSASSCSRRSTACSWLRRRAVFRNPSFWRRASSARSLVLAKVACRIAFAGGTPSYTSENVRSTLEETSSGARNSPWTGTRGHSATQ